MKKWYDEEYEWEIEVIGFLRGDHTERYCRNGEEIGDKYTCTYGCPVNQDGQGICSKCMESTPRLLCVLMAVLCLDLLRNRREPRIASRRNFLTISSNFRY